jgi:phage tail sheath protein FI
MVEFRSPGVYVEEVPSAVRPIAGVSTSTAGFLGVLDDTMAAAGSAGAGDVKLCRSFAEFTTSFGDFSITRSHQMLAHAVYGFFNNGGTRCYVVRAAQANAAAALATLAAIDEIAIVAAPGLTTLNADLIEHCRAAGDRFAILDSREAANAGDLTLETIAPQPGGENAALYFPWLQVFDPATKAANPQGDGSIFVPPSGHLAGIYARVDSNRGVHKAPANEVVHGALGLRYALGRAQVEALVQGGVNAIRTLNGNILVWGARTIGGDGDFKYVSSRRLYLYLSQSIAQGTQWVAFEPNAPPLWEQITRTVTTFLSNVWRDGALPGSSPRQAFFVRCDATTNPADLRAQGRLAIEIGVAILRPAEFVVIRINLRSASAA